MPAEPALDGRIGCAVWLVILKGLDGNSIFLQIFNLHTIQFHILSCSSWLQFVRVLILFWAHVLWTGGVLQSSRMIGLDPFCKVTAQYHGTTAESQLDPSDTYHRNF